MMVILDDESCSSSLQLPPAGLCPWLGMGPRLMKHTAAAEVHQLHALSTTEGVT